jgi:hypothetical protein
MDLPSLDFDQNSALMMDGNAVAGLLQEIFSTDMTTSAVCCAHCGRVGAVGTLDAFTHCPGIVLRCPDCDSVLMRIVRSPRATHIDIRGCVYLSIPS